MDIFKFRSPTSPTKLEQGQIINGLKSKMWIERYREGGEFTLVANADTNMRETLPIGSIISHVGTTEVMMVENHEISDVRGKETEIVITGRGFETFLENRIVGSNKNYPTVTAPADYNLAAAFTWNQAVSLISDHILASFLIDDNNQIPFVSIMTTVTGSGVSAARVIKLGDLYSALMELLAVDDLGIKIIRPGPWSPLTAGSPNIAIVIHKGVNRSSQIMFSYDTGEIESADYLWSNKQLKNAALVSGRWVEVLVPGTAFDFSRRMMYVDASDLDEKYAAAPTGVTLTAVKASMTQRGLEALAAQKDIALTKAEVSKDATRAVYRTDFDVGDTITVNGDYNETSSMRVSEYVEIDDEEGVRGYPTLTVG